MIITKQDLKDPQFWNLGGWVFVIAAVMSQVEGHTLLTMATLSFAGFLFLFSLYLLNR